MTPTSTRDARIAVVGAFVCVSIMVAARWLPRLATAYAAERATAADLRTRLARHQSAVEVRGETQASLTLARARFDTMAAALFVDARANAAAAQAATHFVSIARDSRAALDAIQLTIDTVGAPLVLITMAISARTDVRGLTQMMSAAEAGSKAFRVTALSVSRPDVTPRTDAPETLDIRLTVQTLALVGLPAGATLGALRGARSNPDVSNAARFIASHNPFRLDRRRAPLAFGIRRTPPPLVAERPRPVPRPTFVLRGIVGGPPWEALVDGLPGRSGSVLVRPGDRIGRFMIHSITRERVIITGPDTTWALGAVPLWP